MHLAQGRKPTHSGLLAMAEAARAIKCRDRTFACSERQPQLHHKTGQHWTSIETKPSRITSDKRELPRKPVAHIYCKQG